ncbi:hypothetical protein DCS_04398 [Drechmeria coniospora]|uniref:Uncharacterized protein n=1 Tax=Drechmeria coniospora TaxID=98403 RepID=A0A151GJX3_DRECN|nr:hypothetical protein DCS_04398 [Drechmeria coniospora]KYK57389.1 hypothetical protein DCS_04398 [Drechmeria coniospora]ODA79952.1 hypothetical protein RJ55_05549 [Drechmeria coniospora]
MIPVFTTSSRIASNGLRFQQSQLRTFVKLRQQPSFHRILAPTTSRHLTSHAPLRSKEDNQQPSQGGQGNSNPGELPAFSFNGLGASPAVKNAIIVVICILGTIETWVWCKWIWNWWKGSGAEAEHQVQAAH